jgi:hypothetical protein
MDQDTLLAHRHLWTRELDSERCLTDLAHLTHPEKELFQLLISNKLGINIRFEQEWLQLAMLHQAIEIRHLRAQR